MWWSWKNCIFSSFLFGRVWLSWKNWFLTVSTWQGCGCLERTAIITVSNLQEAVVIFNELIFNSFFFGIVWWSWKNWFSTVSTLRECGWSWKNWFLTVSLLGGVWWLLKELIFNSFYFGRIWQSWKNWFSNSLYFKRVWWSWKNWFLTVSTFKRVWWSWKNWILTVSTLRVCVVVLKELIFNSFYFGRCGNLERIDF